MTYAEVAPSKVTAAEVTATEVAAAMTATMATAMTASSATSCECRARQRGQKNHNDNSTAFRHCYPLPVVAPPHLAQSQCDGPVWSISSDLACCSICADTPLRPPA